MRRLKTKTQEKIDQKRKNRFIVGASIFMLILLVFSSVGFAFLSGSGFSGGEEDPYPTNEVTGNQIEFLDQTIGFTHSKFDVSDVENEAYSSVLLYRGNTLYIDSENEQATGEIWNSVGRFAQRVQEACLGQCERDLPEKSCEDHIIIYRESEENRVYQNDNCVFIEGDLRAVDSFLYSAFGEI
ncbi:MAG: hypothetical protein CL811_12875 [Colwelliaceae bacterium]|nr:hypothetical protein [Colwelliaceae bacterium]|tara:strand:+ start:588 stop:1139 length:552 start_codon:yes stop_codon:yes gene_type:complete